MFNPVSPGVSNGATPTPPAKSSPTPMPKPCPVPRPQTRKQHVSASPLPDGVYDLPSHLPPAGNRHVQPDRHGNSNDYDDPDALMVQPGRATKPTVAATYDDIQDVLGNFNPVFAPYCY